jgi:hypothetical protein
MKKLKAGADKKKKTNRKKETNVEDVKVKDIQFAYNNYRVIELLKARGSAITACNWDKMRELE